MSRSNVLRRLSKNREPGMSMGKCSRNLMILYLLTLVIIPPSLTAQIFGEDEIVRSDSLRNSLNMLPWSEKEVREIAEMLDGRVYLKENATEKAFKKNAPHCGIIHLATHAFIDDERPLLSKLVFAVNEDSSEDGYLNTYELYHMELNAHLAVLSACNTGYGKLIRGEGVLNLARGFMYAGCPSVVMSLWPASDKTTAAIMKDFYSGLAEGLQKDAALRRAKLNYLQQANAITANPFYWGGFVSIGDARSLPLTPAAPDPRLPGLLLLLGILLLGLMLVFRMRKQSGKPVLPR